MPDETPEVEETVAPSEETDTPIEDAVAGLEEPQPEVVEVDVVELKVEAEPSVGEELSEPSDEEVESEEDGEELDSSEEAPDGEGPLGNLSPQASAQAKMVAGAMALERRKAQERKRRLG